MTSATAASQQDAYAKRSYRQLMALVSQFQQLTSPEVLAAEEKQITLKYFDMKGNNIENVTYG